MRAVDTVLLGTSYPAWFMPLMVLQWVVPLLPGLAVIAISYGLGESARLRLLNVGLWLLLLGALGVLVSLPFGGPVFLWMLR